MINFQNLNIYFNIKHMQPKKKNCLSDCDNLSSNNSNTNNQESIYTSELTNKIYQYDYDALVLTDISQNILWVNDGFKNMTGYTKKFAIGKKPSFLQGEKTSTIVKKQLRESLAFNHTYCGSIINYRRNGELYLCQITILPIYNLDEKLKYYVAIEKDETKMNRSD